MPTKVSELQASVLQWQTRTRMMSDSAAGSMASSYEVILGELEPRLQALSAQIKARQDAGEAFSPSWLFRQQRYVEMIRQTKLLVDQYSAFAQQNLTSQQMAAVQAAYLESVKQLRTMGRAGTDPSSAYGFAGMNDQAITNLVGALQEDTPLGQLFSSLGDDGVENLKTGLVRDLGLGLGIDRIVSNMRTALSIPGYRAARIARTEILRATNEGLRDAFGKMGVVKMWRWSAALSARTCPACLAKNGKLFPLSQPMQRHVQCRCSMSPWLGDGTDAAWESGDDWLKGQPATVQDAVLRSQEAGAAFRAGKVALDDFSYLHENSTWGDSFQVRSWRSVSKSKGLPEQFRAASVPGGTQGLTGRPAAVLGEDVLGPAVPAPQINTGTHNPAVYLNVLGQMQRDFKLSADAALRAGDLKLSPAERDAAKKEYRRLTSNITRTSKTLSRLSGVPHAEVMDQVWGKATPPAVPKVAVAPKPKPAAKPKAAEAPKKRTPAEITYDAVFADGRTDIDPDDEDSEDAMALLFRSKRGVQYDVESELDFALGVDPKLAEALTRKNGFLDMEIPDTVIDPSKVQLVPTQNWLHKPAVDKYLKGQGVSGYDQGVGGVPWLVKMGDEYFIVDGHHRLAAARITGSQSITVKVAEFDRSGNLITPHKSLEAPASAPKPKRQAQVTPQQAWKPKMTTAEADAWTADAAPATKRVWLHGTGTKTAATSITKGGFDLSRKANGRMYGNGVYMTNKGQTTAAYAYGDTPTVLELRVYAKKPIDSEELFASPEYTRFYDEASQWSAKEQARINRSGLQGKYLDQEIQKSRLDPRSDPNAYALDQALVALGGDAITVRLGDDEEWIIIPDTERVTVVGSGPIDKYEKVKT